MPTPTRELRKERSAELTAAAAEEKRKRNEERKAQLDTEIVEHVIPDAKRTCAKCASTEMAEGEP
jgi:hypothetical protein